MGSVIVYYGDQCNEFTFNSDTLISDLLADAIMHFRISTKNWVLKNTKGEQLNNTTLATSVCGQDLKLFSIPKAYIPSNDILHQTEDREFEVTVDHVITYQKLLSSRSGNRNGPLLTKKLRMQEDAQKNNDKVRLEHCEIRARFPDRTFIDLQFSATDTIGTVYNTIKESLSYPDDDFVIALSHPYRKLENISETIQDASFGRKTLVLVEIKGSSPYLKSDLLKSAQPSSHSRTNISETSKESNGLVQTHKPENTAKKLTKTPKWLKLSKK